MSRRFNRWTSQRAKLNLRGTAASLQTRVSRLEGITGAVEFAQIGKTANREPMSVAFACFEQRVDILRHLGARFFACRGGAVLQEVISQHDAVDGGLHGPLSWIFVSQARPPQTWRSPDWRV